MRTTARRATLRLMTYLLSSSPLLLKLPLASASPQTNDPSNKNIIKLAKLFADISPENGLSIKALMDVTGVYSKHKIHVIVQISRKEDFSSLLSDEIVVVDESTGYFVDKKYPQHKQPPIYVRAYFIDPLKGIKNKSLGKHETPIVFGEQKKANFYH